MLRDVDPILIISLSGSGPLKIVAKVDEEAGGAHMIFAVSDSHMETLERKTGS